MVKVFLHHQDLMEDPNPAPATGIEQLRLFDVDPQKMERQLDGIGTKYLDILYFDIPNWQSLDAKAKEYARHKVRLGKFTDHEAWLEINGTVWKYPEIVNHIGEVQVLLDQERTEMLLKEIDE